MGTLYVVATPIGNLDDISKRALETLSGVDLILAEDTRVARKLLDSFGVTTYVESYHQHTGEEKKLYVLKILMDGKNIALISDAGTPGISDPGNELIDFLYDSGFVYSDFLEASGEAARNPAVTKPTIKIIPIPGPSAVSSALSVCGFDVSRYIFLGFWPKRKAGKIVDMLRDTNMPFVYFDSPHRVVKNLERIAVELGSERRVFVGRELTKMHETHYRGAIGEVVTKLDNEKHLKGEVVVIVE